MFVWKELTAGLHALLGTTVANSHGVSIYFISITRIYLYREACLNSHPSVLMPRFSTTHCLPNILSIDLLFQALTHVGQQWEREK